MSDILDGWRLGEQMQNTRLDRERQAKLDAVAAEEMQRKREEWARNDKIRTDTGAMMTSALQGAEQDMPDGTLGFRTQYGLAPQQGPAFNPRMDSQAADMGYGNEVAAGLAPPQAPTTIKRNSAAHKAAVEQMRWAQAAQKPDEFYKAKQSFDQADMGAQASRVYQSALEATPEQMSRFANSFTSNTHIKGKAKLDPKTNMTTIELESGGAVQLDKIGAATYIAGLWKLNNGDPTGLVDIAKVDERLAAAAKDSFDALNKVTATANDVSYKGQALGIDRARLGVSQAAEARAAKRDREVDPAVMAKLNDLAVQYETETDPAKRKLIEQQHRMLSATAATQLNKPVQLGGDRTTPPKEEDIASVVARLEQEPANKGKSYAALRAQAISMVTGRDVGGLPAWGGGKQEPEAPQGGLQRQKSPRAQMLWGQYLAMEPSWRNPDTPTNQYRRQQVYQEYFKEMQQAK